MSLYPGMGCEDQLRTQVSLLTEALRLERERNRAVIAELVEALKNIVEQYEGVYDCVDHTGTSYQSQAAADAVIAAMCAITKHSTKTKEQ